MRDEDKTKEELIAELSELRDKLSSKEDNRPSDFDILSMVERVSKMGSWRWYPKENRVEWSENMLSMYGIDPNDFEPTYDYAIKFTHPDDFDRVNDQVLNAANTKQKNDPIEYRIINAKNELLWITATSEFIFDDDGELNLIIGTVQDISRHKDAEQKISLSEERYRSLAENSQDYIMRYDLDGRHLYQNAAAYRVSGFSEDEFVGKTHRELGFDEELCELWETRIQEVIRTKISLGEIFEWESVDGKVYLDWRLYPEFDNQGNVISVLGVSRDISEYKQLEEQLFQSQKMEAIGTLAGGIAHDFNNLLVPILGLTDILKLTAEEKHQHYLDMIFESANRAKDLVQKILLVSRKTSSSSEPIHLESLLEEISSVLRASIPANVSIIEDFEYNLPTISGDSSQIFQVILNLCNNAIQAMEDGGDLIIKVNRSRFQLPKTEKEEDVVCLLIKDSGCGMTDDILERMYDPFFTTKEKGEQRGTGLGLAMVSSIVKQHGGVIDVQSTLGKGSEFRIYFPCIEEATFEFNQQYDFSPIQTDAHILLVDDEKMSCVTGTAVLEKLGFEVTNFLDPKEALHAFESDPDRFKFIITDYSMPNYTGPELIKKIKAISPDIPVLLVTGYSNLVTQENIKEWGCDYFIAKPYNIKTLSQVVGKILSQ